MPILTANAPKWRMDVALPAPKPSIDTCHACGKLFPRQSMQLCSTCAMVEENRFTLVRDFLVTSDGAAVGQIARATGVSTMDVRRFLDSGRLVVVATGLETCTCGGVGTRCRACRAQLSGAFRKLETEMRTTTSDPGSPNARRGGSGGDEARGDSGGRNSFGRRIRREL